LETAEHPWLVQSVPIKKNRRRVILRAPVALEQSLYTVSSSLGATAASSIRLEDILPQIAKRTDGLIFLHWPSYEARRQMLLFPE
jgi:hypothetical protein